MLEAELSRVWRRWSMREWTFHKPATSFCACRLSTSYHETIALLWIFYDCLRHTSCVSAIFAHQA